MAKKHGRRTSRDDWIRAEKLFVIRNWKRHGLTNEEVAKNIGIHISTLYKWADKEIDIREALKRGKQEAIAIVENKLFAKAISGNMTAIIFWLKNNAREYYNDSPLTPEEIALARERYRKAKAEADIAEFQAKELTAIENAPTSTTIINDIPMVKGEDHADSKTERAD